MGLQNRKKGNPDSKRKGGFDTERGGKVGSVSCRTRGPKRRQPKDQRCSSEPEKASKAGEDQEARTEENRGVEGRTLDL